MLDGCKTWTLFCDITLRKLPGEFSFKQSKVLLEIMFWPFIFIYFVFLFRFTLKYFYLVETFICSFFYNSDPLDTSAHICSVWKSLYVYINVSMLCVSMYIDSLVMEWFYIAHESCGVVPWFALRFLNTILVVTSMTDGTDLSGIIMLIYQQCYCKLYHYILCFE